MLSVIIPTRNRAGLLELALQSLVQQTLSQSRYEVLVVDNGSTDHTRSVVESFDGRIERLQYLYDAEPGLHVGRHRGLREAAGEVLVYADDDIQAVPTWLQAIEDCFSDPSVALVGGNNYPRFEGDPPEWLRGLWRTTNRRIGGQAIASLSVLKLAEGRRTISPHWVWGCNFSIRRRVLLDAGGFHPDGMPQELLRFRGDGETHVSEHVLRSGLVCLFDSDASVYHAVPRDRMTFEYFKRRAFNQGISDSFTALRNGAAAGGALAALAAATVRRLRALLSELRVDECSRTLGRMMSEGYRKGFEFHQQAYREDAQLRAWVHRPDYF